MAPPPFDGAGRPAQGTKQGFGTGGALGQARPLQLVSPNQVSGMQASNSGTNVHQCRWSCKTLTYERGYRAGMLS